MIGKPVGLVLHFFLISTARAFEDPMSGVYSRTVRLRTGGSPHEKNC